MSKKDDWLSPYVPLKTIPSRTVPVHNWNTWGGDSTALPNFDVQSVLSDIIAENMPSTGSSTESDPK
jgi:nitrogen fixation protein